MTSLDEHVVPSITSRSAAMCAGVVPQHPPVTCTPWFSTNRCIAPANSIGPSGNTACPSRSSGIPAFGTTEMGRSQCRESHATASDISKGPVPQFNPSDAIGKGRSAARIAGKVLPSNIAPLVSSVTFTRTGTSVTSPPRSAIASRQALIAHLTCRRSCAVSIMKASTPPLSRPSACSR